MIGYVFDIIELLWQQHTIEAAKPDEDMATVKPNLRWFQKEARLCLLVKQRVDELVH